MSIRQRKNIPLTLAAAFFLASGQNGRSRGSMRFSVIVVSFQIPFAPAVLSVNGVRRLPHMCGTLSRRHPWYIPCYKACVCVINLRRACAKRWLCTCPVCVYVFVSVCSFLPPCASTPRNIGTYVFTATRKIIVKMIDSEATASFACHGWKANDSRDFN